MRIIPWQEDNFTLPHFDRRLPRNYEQHPALCNIMIGNDVAWHRAERRTIPRPDMRGNAPRRREFALHENTARETHRTEHFRQRVHGRVPRSEKRKIWRDGKTIRRLAYRVTETPCVVSRPKKWHRQSAGGWA